MMMVTIIDFVAVGTTDGFEVTFDTVILSRKIVTGILLKCLLNSRFVFKLHHHLNLENHWYSKGRLTVSSKQCAMKYVTMS